MRNTYLRPIIIVSAMSQSKGTDWTEFWLATTKAVEATHLVLLKELRKETI